MIPNFAYGLKNHLRKTYVHDEMEAIPGQEPLHTDISKHVPNQLSQLIMTYKPWTCTAAGSSPGISSLY